MSYERNIRVMIPREGIANKVKELGARLTADFKDQNIVLIGVLKGSFIFLADLVREIDLPVEIDFISAKSYSGTTSTGVVNVKMDTYLNIEGKIVMLVEDILDTGKTLYALRETMYSKGAKDVKIVTFLDKPARRVADINADYSCYTIDDCFVVGYGLDYDEAYRNLDYVGEVLL